MGIIIKQSIRGSIWSYIGVIIGFITTSYFYPRYLTPEVVGLFGLLTAISTITSQISSLGFNGVTSRLFTFFRSPGNGHNGFLFLSVVVQVTGYILFVIFFFFYRQTLIENNIEKSRLFVEFVYLLLPLTFFTMMFMLLDGYNKVLYDGVLGIFLQDFIQRLLTLVVILLYIFHVLTLSQFIVGFVVSVSFKGLILLVYLIYRGEISLRPRLNFLDKKLKKEMKNVAVFSIIAGMGSMLVFNIDKIVINQLLDLKSTGVYTIAFFFGTLVVIPSRPLLRISLALIADAWAKSDTDKIKEIYYKSCINQFLIGGFLFLGIWANIDNIITILGPQYVESKWVIFFIGLGYLIDMMTGANGLILDLSKYYRISLVFIFILILLVVGLLYLLIPIWGIVGAAIAITLALLLNNFLRFIFLYHKYQMQPFDYKFIVVMLFFIGLYFAISVIPQQQMVLDILIRGSIITVSFILFVIVVPVADDIKAILLKMGKKFL